MCKSEIDKDVELFKIALETRNFEIQLFWKRCSYFLAINTALVTALAAAMFALSNGSNQEAFWPLFFGICFAGFFICIAWIQVAFGSQFWQKHWEWVVEKHQESLGFKNDEDDDADGTIRKDYFSRKGVNDRVADYLGMDANAKKKAKAEAEKGFKGLRSILFVLKILQLSLLFLVGKGEDKYYQFILRKPSVSNWMQRTAMFFLWMWLVGIFLALGNSGSLAWLPMWLREGFRALCKMCG